jgi:hypothetical protein
VFIEATNLSTLVTSNNFEVNLEVNGDGLLGYQGLEICDGEVKNLLEQLHSLDADLLIYVGDPSLQCPEGPDDPNNPDECGLLSTKVGMTCCSLMTALKQNEPGSLKIEVIKSADLNDVVAIYGNKVLIAPYNSNSYVVLVIGVHGTIYVESGELFSAGLRNQLSNELQLGNVTFSRMEIQLAFKAGGVPNPFIVVRDGSVTFDACIILSGSGNAMYPNHVTVYIADVVGSGLVEFKDCSISNMYVEESPLIQAFDDGKIVIKVIIFFPFFF